MKTPKELLTYLQKRFKHFLEQRKVDIVDLKEDHFEIGWPSFEANGTTWYEVFPKKDGIRVILKNWNEYFPASLNFETLYDETYKDIDAWMKTAGFNPSEKDSRPKKNYRR